jgi:hypothetical protein
MSKVVKRLFSVSATLIYLSWASFHYGPPYDRSLLSFEEIAFSYCGCDSDVGERWEILGGGLFLLAISIGMGGLMFWSREREHNR